MKLHNIVVATVLILACAGPVHADPQFFQPPPSMLITPGTPLGGPNFYNVYPNGQTYRIGPNGNEERDYLGHPVLPPDPALNQWNRQPSYPPPMGFGAPR